MRMIRWIANAVAEHQRLESEGWTTGGDEKAADMFSRAREMTGQNGGGHA